MNQKKLKEVFFSHSINSIQEYLDICIKAARGKESESLFFSDVTMKFNIREFLHFMLGRRTIEALTRIVSNCEHKVLVTLDEFDTIFDMFRRSADSDHALYTRTQFEIDWLRSFLLLVIDIKDKAYNSHPLFKSLNFCITIPKDRYSEIERSDRDGYRYNNRTCNLLWSGIDLCILLIKRLEKITDYKTKPNDKPHERLKEIFDKKLTSIPFDLNFEFNGKNISIPLFCYVLRHTFWRPRDILLYYSNIIAASNSMGKNQDKLSTSTIRRIIGETTYQIIKTEFIDEYNTTILNIREIINSFFEHDQIFYSDELTEHLDTLEFKFSALLGKEVNVHSKVEFLYDIGFLGLALNKNDMKKNNIEFPHNFYFNEGTTAFRTSKKREFNNTAFLVHPIFFENLQLNYDDMPFSLYFDWEYLYENHSVLAAARNQF